MRCRTLRTEQSVKWRIRLSNRICVINKNSRNIKRVFLERFDNTQLEKHCVLSWIVFIKYSFNSIINLKEFCICFQVFLFPISNPPPTTDTQVALTYSAVRQLKQRTASAGGRNSKFTAALNTPMLPASTEATLCCFHCSMTSLSTPYYATTPSFLRYTKMREKERNPRLILQKGMVLWKIRKLLAELQKSMDY